MTHRIKWIAAASLLLIAAACKQEEPPPAPILPPGSLSAADIANLQSDYANKGAQVGTVGAISNAGSVQLVAVGGLDLTKIDPKETLVFIDATKEVIGYGRITKLDLENKQVITEYAAAQGKRALAVGDAAVYTPGK